jgi:hypothetical protein
VRQREHRIHVVLDQHDRVLRGEKTQQRDDALRLLRAHAGERLVEQ